jgi:hypothetical protein
MMIVTNFILYYAPQTNRTGSGLANKEAYVSNESNFINNHTIIAKIVRICVIYQSEFMVFDEELSSVILLALITHHTPNLPSCNDIRFVY